MPLDDIALARLIMENVRSHGILGFTPDGVVTAWSAGAEAITGYSRDEALGMNFHVLFTEADRAARMPEMEIETARREGRAEDSRWHVRKDGALFWGNGVTVDLDAGGLLAKILRDETPARKAEEQRVLLLNELNHRVKNTLATVQSIAEQTLRASGIDKNVRDGLSSRLIALSQAHNVLVNENWAGADLRALICEVLAPYEREPSPIRLDGPSVRLHPSQAVSVSLACHELATNAAKYGALSTLEGRVEVGWNLAQNSKGERFLTLLWRETGGPAVEPPTREGFGARLIRQTFAGEEGRPRPDPVPARGGPLQSVPAVEGRGDDEAGTVGRQPGRRALKIRGTVPGLTQFPPLPRHRRAVKFGALRPRCGPTGPAGGPGPSCLGRRRFPLLIAVGARGSPGAGAPPGFAGRRLSPLRNSQFHDRR